MKRRTPQDRQAQLHNRRQRVAYEAARLIAIQGLQDIQLAKRKAARQLGFDDEASLPGNLEVQQQLRDYQRLFQGDQQPGQLRRRREAALQAMAFFSAFQPRLVGSVLEGTADAHSAIALQVFSDDAEDFARFLLDARMPSSPLPARRLRLDRDHAASFPGWSLVSDGLVFELTVMPLNLLRQAPLGAGDKPMPRASLAVLRGLLLEQPPAPDAA